MGKEVAVKIRTGWQPRGGGGDEGVKKKGDNDVKRKKETN